MKKEISNLHQMMFNRYGPTMKFREVADCIGIAYTTLRGTISTDSCPVKTYKSGKLRLAHTSDVVAYIESRAA